MEQEAPSGKADVKAKKKKGRDRDREREKERERERDKDRERPRGGGKDKDGVKFQSPSPRTSTRERGGGGGDRGHDTSGMFSRKRSFESSSAMDESPSSNRLWGGLMGAEYAETEGTIMVWTCTLCTLENSMRARQCDACGERREYAIRGHPAEGDGSPRQAPKRVKISGPSANPPKHTPIGPNYQMDLTQMPTPRPWDRAQAKRDHGMDGNDDCDYWTAVWIPPKTSTGTLLEEAQLSALSRADVEQYSKLCRARQSFQHSHSEALRLTVVMPQRSAASGELDDDDAGAREDGADKSDKANAKVAGITNTVLTARADMEKVPRANALCVLPTILASPIPSHQPLHLVTCNSLTPSPTPK